MRYLCTLLKDMPCRPIGTTFKVLWHTEGVTPSYISSGLSTMKEFERCRDLFYLIDNTEWIKKEVDVETALNLACSICGETRVFLKSTLRSLHNEYVKANDVGIILEYVCGHTPRTI